MALPYTLTNGTTADADEVMANFDYVESEFNSSIESSKILIGQNALNILDLTAKASLTVGTNANFIRDIYTDANGYLNSIDTASTTAIFDTNKYKFTPYSITANKNSKAFTATNGDDNVEIIITATAKKNIIVSKLGGSFQSGSGDNMFWITKSGSTIASKNVGSGTLATFVLTDYSDIILAEETFEMHFDVGSGDQYYQTGVSEDNDYYSFSNQRIVGGPAGLIEVTEVNFIESNLIQSNVQNLTFEPTYFMIVSNEVVGVDEEILYDISFDNGSNFQENLSSYNTYEISNPGQQMIIKQKLIGDTLNSPYTYNYGVLIW